MQFYILFYQYFDTFVFVLIEPVHIIIIYALLCFWIPFICKGLYVSESEDFMKMYLLLVDVKLMMGCFSDGKAAKTSCSEQNAKAMKKEKKEVVYLDPPDGGWGWMVVLHCFLVCHEAYC